MALMTWRYYSDQNEKKTNAESQRGSAREYDGGKCWGLMHTARRERDRSGHRHIQRRGAHRGNVLANDDNGGSAAPP